MTKKIILVAIFQIIAVAWSSCPLCANIERFIRLVEHNLVLDSTFMILKNFGLVRCVQQCLFRKRCESVNFDVSTQICELNQITTKEPQFKNGSIFAEISKWPQGLALQCEKHTCPSKSACTITTSGGTKCTQDPISPLDIGYRKAIISSFYYKFHDDPKSYVDSEATCSMEGGRLLQIESNEKNNFIKGILENFDTEIVTIGATDRVEEGDWRWSGTNTKLTYTDWGVHEPNNYLNSEDCATMKRKTGWRWNDNSCNRARSFLCEITYT